MSISSVDTSKMSPLELATHRQQLAADPFENIYVSANAGSGKTRVLVSRVARLLLSDKTLQPSKILCLTYTKAAAAEMQSRLFALLGEWSIADDETLTQALNSLDGKQVKRSKEALRDARNLFAKALETPEGLKVQTLHAFCERLLRRFPIEAGIAPGYEALDDADRSKLLSKIKDQIFERALEKPSSDLAKSITLLARDKSDDFISNAMIWAANNMRGVQNWAKVGLGPLAETLALNVDDTASGIQSEIMANIPRAAMKAAADELSRSGSSNQKIAQKIYGVLEAPDEPNNFDAYLDIFFTQSRNPRATIAYSKIAEELLGKKDNYGSESERIFAGYDRYLGAKILEQTRAIFAITTEAAKRYGQLKKQMRRLDFNDQTELARDLLTRQEARQWVLYKLDQGVDHILIDEAQDTAPRQWDIIDAVSAEFAHDRDANRTKFAVGDEKQSIYSFQGAKPELFLDRLQKQVAANSDTKNISLTMSFRSAENILTAVDAVFVDAGAVNHIFDRPPAGDLPRHQANRSDSGRVELWPIAPAPEKGEAERAWDFTKAVDAPSALSAREQLAKTIARTVSVWLETGETITERSGATRPMRAGDIMILVKKRSSLFDAVIRNLKLMGVAVAGADRLTLTDNIGVQDLISLGKFIALPSDDLSLAEVLKSPIFGLADDHLLQIAYDRKDSLWESLCEKAAQNPTLLEARSVLREIMGFAPELAPYEFYARVLSTLMPARGHGPRESILRRIYSRLGVEAADPIDVFLSRALAHQRSGPPALDRFLRDMADDDNQVKREADNAANEVRVMTVHGAKGLEAPVIILPDTTDAPKGKARPFEMQSLDETEQSGYVLRAKSGQAPAALAHLNALQEQSGRQESLRLLYVAMTRAESRLIICGHQFRSKAYEEDSWYDWVKRGFEHIPHGEIKREPQDFGEALCFGARAQSGQHDAAQQRETALPDWISQKAKQEPSATRRVTPSHLLAGPDASGAPAIRSPLDILTPSMAGAGLGRFGRGNLIHKLLEILPDAEPQRRNSIAESYLSAQSFMTPELEVEITEEVFAVLEHPDFAALFSEGSRAEVSLAGSAKGLPEGVFINAQIDRLSVTETEVWIVDYKSNRPPPQTQDAVADIYIAQLAAYRALARDIYPDKAVRCALLWTDEPRLMVINDTRLDDFDLRKALTR